MFSCNEIEQIEEFDIESTTDLDQFHQICYLDTAFKRNVRLQGFYKDIFMDAGAYLKTRKSLSAASYLGYSLESVSLDDNSDTLWQNTVIAGNDDDINGRLLYPDGQPRYRMIFVCGGSSRSHGKSLRPSCLNRMRTFVHNGGSYVGTCAGAFFASEGYDDNPDYPYYLGIWPGIVRHTGLVQTYTGMFVEDSSPLLHYYDFGNDNYVADIRHNKGGYAAQWPEGTELLASYDCPEYPSVHEKPAAWAYKSNFLSGRVIMEGSHPEEVTKGERRDLTAAMLCYAADGVGDTTIKGILNCGEPWIMDKTTLDSDPAHTMIGDLQYHHFVVYIPENVRDVDIILTSSADCDFQLSLCSDTYAYADMADYVSSTSGANQELFFPSLTEGYWYIAVQCLTTVIAEETPLGQNYVGRTDVLNGIPYSLLVRYQQL